MVIKTGRSVRLLRYLVYNLWIFSMSPTLGKGIFNKATTL